MRTIKIKNSRETLKSRIPGLFAFVEQDDNEVFVLNKATNSPSGCYGKIIENIILPVSLYDEDDDGNVYSILSSGNTYSYGTIMNYYYQYAKTYNSNTKHFIDFVNRAIGKIDVPSTVTGDCVPEYVYLSECSSLYKELLIMQNKCKLYHDEFESKGVKNESLCCICSKYECMGGDKLLAFVKSNIQLAESEASYFLSLADTSNTVSVVVGVPIVLTSSDAGSVSPYENTWVPGKRYYAGEIVTWNNVSYLCAMRLGSYTTGWWNSTTCSIEFESSDNPNFGGTNVRFVRVTDTNLPLWFYNHDEWYNSSNPYGNYDDLHTCDSGQNYVGEGYSISGNTDSKLSTFREMNQYVGDDDMLHTPDDGYDWLYYYKIGLVSVRSLKKDEFSNVEMIEGYSRDTTSGNVEYHLQAYGDVIEDIAYLEYEEVDESEVLGTAVDMVSVPRLVHGFHPQYIKVDDVYYSKVNNNTLTFQYTIGCHLAAEYDTSTTDSDGNVRYFYKDFFIDKYDTHGITYIEKHRYTDDGIKELISNGLFDTYVDFDSYRTVFQNYRYDKFAFRTDDSTESVVVNINGSYAVYTPIIAEYEEVIDTNEKHDMLRANIYHDDATIGLVYNPEVESDVNIDRGNAAAIERHIKLGEVKTMESLEEYANNGFFNIQ